MILALAVTSALLIQAAGHPTPVRVWRADSTAYFQLSKPGHVALLHVDAIGRIEVLFPLIPEDTFTLSNASPVAVALPPSAEGNPATFVAVWSRWPLDFTAIRAGSDWNYDVLLMQPTAGDPLGALLDIADRVTDGRPYEYGGVKYSRTGAVAALGSPVQPDVCLSCVRHATPVAAATTVASNSVDCSNGSFTNSFCGVNSGSVAITNAPQVIYQPAPAAPAAVYVPYYLPVVVHGGRSRFERPILPRPSAPRPSFGAAYPIAPRLVVPSRADIRNLSKPH